MGQASLAMARREWSSEVMDLHFGVISEAPVGDIGCQHGLGNSAWKHFYADRGRFCGCGMTNPCRLQVGTGIAPI
jgi:hypothetical protein